MYHEVVLVGVALSLLFSELTGLSPAGLVVPGYIALSLQTPGRVLYTLLIALLAWGVARLLARWMILYGRRRFAVLILLSFLINALIVGSGILPYDPGMIGVLVPGIIANEVEKQGVLKSMLSLAVVVGVLVLLMMWRGMKVFPT
ncbi:poly-gamma-glutamate biosynthesis protein PgsC [Pseudoflavonifractor phocaeensis]|uniref:poly-gamma-glutamate biosynthesis protein PgsC n=1 Tax=Pseudoflavonifractor phocaeensis TaxID=1870988 RepID=UPI001F22E8D7|nr:poly-gamma-glutamate biosynthesis protein PgsC [Pseudoflavonifractor phocaeensis]MCF2596479.1 poly-gamma-glutamate biosynthesis protein PgsC [Pseudoflavonifractor phocaeensis]